jgi:hypothetical protein
MPDMLKFSPAQYKDEGGSQVEAGGMNTQRPPAGSRGGARFQY